MIKRFLNSLLSRKFILAVIAGSIAFGNAYFDWGMKLEEIMVILAPFLTFIGVEGVKDIEEAKRK